MDNVRAVCRASIVLHPLNEGDNWTRVVWDSKVWPASVVELFNLSCFSSLQDRSYNVMTTPYQVLLV